MLNEFNKYLMDYRRKINLTDIINKKSFTFKRGFGLVLVFMIYKFYQFIKNKKNKIQTL